MEKEVGKLKVNAKLNGYIKQGKTRIGLPADVYDFSPREEYNNKDCQFTRENGLVTGLWIDGKEVPKNQKAIQEKEEKKKRREAKALENEAYKKLSKEYKDYSLFNFENVLAPKTLIDLELEEYQVENMHLKLNKFAQYEENSGKYKFIFFKVEGREKIIKELKFDYSFIEDIPRIADTQKQAIEGLCDTQYRCLTMQPEGRFVTGLGGASVYETSITLHHIYGYPYIPASSVKGRLRSHILLSFFDAINNNARAEKEAMNDPLFVLLFGTDQNGIDSQSHRGALTYFDALPVIEPTISADILNAHYSEYYTNTKDRALPTDTQSPVPVNFLTVEKTPFQFCLGWQLGHSTVYFNACKESKVWKKYCKNTERSLDESISVDILLDVANYYLKEAIQYRGLGAKTASGYGYFEDLANK